MLKYSLFAAALLLSSQARADDFEKRELAFQALNIADGVVTIDCLRRDVCVEGNPFYGKSPSTEKIVAIKVVTTAPLTGHSQLK